MAATWLDAPDYADSLERDAEDEWARERTELCPPHCQGGGERREVAVLRRERDGLDRKAEGLRRELERVAGYVWSLECDLADARHELEVARS